MFDDEEDEHISASANDWARLAEVYSDPAIRQDLLRAEEAKKRKDFEQSDNAMQVKDKIARLYNNTSQNKYAKHKPVGAHALHSHLLDTIDVNRVATKTGDQLMKMGDKVRSPLGIALGNYNVSGNGGENPLYENFVKTAKTSICKLGLYYWALKYETDEEMLDLVTRRARKSQSGAGGVNGQRERQKRNSPQALTAEDLKSAVAPTAEEIAHWKEQANAAKAAQLKTIHELMHNKLEAGDMAHNSRRHKKYKRRFVELEKELGVYTDSEEEGGAL